MTKQLIVTCEFGRLRVCLTGWCHGVLLPRALLALSVCPPLPDACSKLAALVASRAT
jgi:hypothetical protein